MRLRLSADRAGIRCGDGFRDRFVDGERFVAAVDFLEESFEEVALDVEVLCALQADLVSP